MKIFKVLIFLSLSIFSVCSFANDTPITPQYSPDGQCFTVTTDEIALSACNNAVIRIIEHKADASYVLTPITPFKDFSVKSCVVIAKNGTMTDYVHMNCPDFSIRFESFREHNFMFKSELERKFKIEKN